MMPKILVVGSCGMDRLIGVSAYPKADSKVRTTSYHEVGGGNAANTAHAMALLSEAAFFRYDCGDKQDRPYVVQLCTKVGGDHVGTQLVEELQTAGVDVSSPLFKIGQASTTTAFTSIIVSEKGHTRTCLYTPGTCGELNLLDLESVDMDKVFSDVVHLHSDSRHTEVALVLAREARRRNIMVSLDIEKDRNSPALDALFEEASIVFTNAHQLEGYIDRLTREQEHSTDREPLEEPTILGTANSLTKADSELFAHVIRPSAYFRRWFNQPKKEVIITKGERGSIHVNVGTFDDDDADGSSNHIEILSREGSKVSVAHRYTDRSVKDHASISRKANYQIQTAGVLPDVSIVDSTGAGDAFIGGFLLARLKLGNTSNDALETCLQIGSWVGGRKLQGPGSRTALPTAYEFDQLVGLDVSTVRSTLSQLLKPFGLEASYAPVP